MKQLSLTIILACTFLYSQGQTKNFIDQPYLEVTETADTLVTPNEIFIKINISEKDTKGKTSLEDLERSMYNALKEAGIDADKYLTTSDMASNFKYYFLRGRN